MQGVLFIVAAPSGAGKTTLIHRMLKRVPNGTFSISHTTRPPRHGETDGKDYYFIDDKTFTSMIDKSEFAEWANVHEHKYGTSKSEILRKASSHAYVVFDVDVQGAAALKQAFPYSISCFVLPPSMKVLKQRLMGRGTEQEHSLQVRLNNARKEIEQAKTFDYCIVNDNIDEAVDSMVSILKAGFYRTPYIMFKIKELLQEEV